MTEAAHLAFDYAQLRAQVERALPAEGGDAAGEGERLRAYWEIGRLLNEGLSGRAAYGQRVVARLATDLGVLPRTLYRARKLHARLSADTLALPQLTWSHCRLLATVDDAAARRALTARAAAEGWTVRQLERHLRRAVASDLPPERGRPGTLRITPLGPDAAPAFDLGFGVRRPLCALEHAGKRTRRLLGQLAPGDAVELTVDAKGRPALRRVWGRVEDLLYTYPARLLGAAGAGVVRAELDLGFEVHLTQPLRLRGAAGRLVEATLAQRVAATPGVTVARTQRLASGYAADLYALPGETDPRLIAAAGEHLNAVWAPP